MYVYLHMVYIYVFSHYTISHYIIGIFTHLQEPILVAETVAPNEAHASGASFPMVSAAVGASGTSKNKGVNKGSRNQCQPTDIKKT